MQYSKYIKNPYFIKILPFFILFLLSLSAMSYKLASNTIQSVQARVDGINITLSNTKATLGNDSIWKWQAIITADKHLEETEKIAYSVSWCGESSSPRGQSKGSDCTPESEDFISYRLEQSETVKIANTSFEIEHLGVKCGRIMVKIEAFKGELGKDNYDTGITCDKEFTRPFSIIHLAPLSQFDDEQVDKQSKSISTFFEQIMNQFMGGKIENDPEGIELPPDEPLPTGDGGGGSWIIRE